MMYFSEERCVMCGEIILEGAGRELLENPVIREAYLGK